MRRFVTLAILFLFHDSFWRLDLGLFEEITNCFLQWRRLRHTRGSSDDYHAEPADLRHLAELCADRPGG